MIRFLKYLRRILIFAGIIYLLILPRQHKILFSVGIWTNKEFYTHGVFQDYTDFGIYSFLWSNIESSPYFSPISKSGKENLLAFLDQFEGWISSIKQHNPDDRLASNYSFDRNLIDAQDYFYIYEDALYPKFGCYDIWFYDAQTGLLYYFHDNI